jgi:glycosyltransferase involved in cell wall biosynthesis
MLLSTNMGMGGGAEEQVIHLAGALTERGWKVRIVSMLPPKPMPPGFDFSAIPVDHLGMSRGIPDPRSIWRLRRLLAEFRPDVVHSHMNHANLLARVVRLISPTPVVIGTLHALNMAGVEVNHTRWFELAHRLTDSLSEATTAICHAAADYYRQCRAVPDGKMLVVPNAVDTTAYAFNLEARNRLRREMGLDDQFVWIAVGRMELAKAYPTLLHAFARLDRGSAGTLLICGSGSLHEKLVELAQSLGIAQSVRFLGLRKDIPDLLSAADAFTLSSDSEGLPLVLLQAAAAGLPIIATDVGGNGEIVIDGSNGRLVPAGDPERYAMAMREIQSQPVEQRRKLGDAGRRRVESMFRTDRVVDRWENLYAELLNHTIRDGDYAARRWASNPPTRVNELCTSFPPRGEFRPGEY